MTIGRLLQQILNPSYFMEKKIISAKLPVRRLRKIRKEEKETPVTIVINAPLAPPQYPVPNMPVEPDGYIKVVKRFECW